MDRMRASSEEIQVNENRVIWEANSSRERKPSSLNERAQGAERTLGYLGGQWSALPLI